MALNKDVLGAALKSVRDNFSNKTKDQLIAIYGDEDSIRLAACNAEADAIITHFKNNALLNVPGTGLVAPSGGGAVTGTAVTGTLS